MTHRLYPLRAWWWLHVDLLIARYDRWAVR
jgi:hypothetical protein